MFLVFETSLTASFAVLLSEDVLNPQLAPMRDRPGRDRGSDLDTLTMRIYSKKVVDPMLQKEIEVVPWDKNSQPRQRSVPSCGALPRLQGHLMICQSWNYCIGVGDEQGHAQSHICRSTTTPKSCLMPQTS